jgi:HPt (histidine-containing phosphotransfer) domain-containing protein
VDGQRDEQSDTPSLLPPVDLDNFTELAGNNAERARELADRYVRQTNEQLTKLRDAIATGVASDVKRIAHSAAGSSAMCGMNPMLALLRELERMGQTGQLGGAPRVYAQIEKEFGRIGQFLSAHLEAVTEPHVT